jgi:transposase InsO family protein|tara:strand:+ start:1853 stop:2074 length:222 start_codon:yes stop_codon:yes gene_type:complete
MESFFSSFKTERIGKKIYRTRAQAKNDVFDYIECFYNSTRLHLTSSNVKLDSLNQPISMPTKRHLQWSIYAIC